MGRETTCDVRWRRQSFRAKVLLETDEIIVRGATPLRIPFKDIRKAEVAADTLRVGWNGDTVEFSLGKDAADWAHRILHPKTRVEKLGVKPGQKVAVARLDDAELEADLARVGADIVSSPRSAVSIAFLGARTHADLDRVPALATRIKPDGALWIVSPKGGVEPREAAVRAAAKGAGLVDVKVVRWSESLTANKFVWPTKARGSAAR